MKIKTSELEGRALDYAVGIAQGWITYPTDSIECGMYFHLDPNTAPHGQTESVRYYTPSQHYSKCGMLIEDFKIGTQFGSGYWTAFTGQYRTFGTTLPVAVCRWVVANHLGEEVDIPQYILDLGKPEVYDPNEDDIPF